MSFLPGIETVVEIRNTNHVMKVLSNGVLHIIHDNDMDIEVEDVEEMRKAYFELPEPRPMKAIQEFGSGVGFTLEGRKYAAKHSPNLLGVAYIIDSLSQRLLLRFYVRMWKRDKPKDFFSNVTDAMKWLDGL